MLYILISIFFFMVGYYYHASKIDVNKDTNKDANKGADNSSSSSSTNKPKEKKRKKRVQFATPKNDKHGSNYWSGNSNSNTTTTTTTTVDPVDPAAVGLQLKVLCLDRSGSMVSFGSEVQEGVNEYLSDIQTLHSNIRWSVVTFDDEIEIPVRNKKVTASSKLNETWTTPRGCTALRDGILSSIKIAEEMVKESDSYKMSTSETTSVEIVIFTDGMENASTKISQIDLQKLIKKYKKDGWTFTFLAANQDAIASGASFGFDAGRSMTSSVGRQMSSWKACASPMKFSPAVRLASASVRDQQQYLGGDGSCRLQGMNVVGRGGF